MTKEQELIFKLSFLLGNYLGLTKEMIECIPNSNIKDIYYTKLADLELKLEELYYDGEKNE